MPATVSARASRLTITSSSGSYDVLVGIDGAVDRALEQSSVVVVDSSVVGQVQSGTSTVVLEATEATKTLQGCERLIEQLRAAGVRRGDTVLGVGGGVVQDVVTFVSSVYMRGVPWVYVPTTLMAMADSCIGGKSSINVGQVKNLVGTFHPPQQVIIDDRFLATLTPQATAAGLAEAAKIAYCRGPAAFSTYLDFFSAYQSNPLALIHHVLDAKRWFVEIDEHDRAQRLQLNFGHTFGHAFEVACGHRTSHGAAVALGILCAASHPTAVTSPLSDQLVEHCHTLLADVDLAPALEGFNMTAFEQAFRSDKKHRGDAFTLILPAAEGGVSLVTTRSDDAGWSDVETSISAVLASLSGR